MEQTIITRKENKFQFVGTYNQCKAVRDFVKLYYGGNLRDTILNVTNAPEYTITFIFNHESIAAMCVMEFVKSKLYESFEQNNSSASYCNNNENTITKN